MKPLKHIAVIMDGNGRWAQKRMHPRVWGHIRGASIVSEIVQAASDWGAKALTLYAFSSENFGRPLLEVQVLFKILKKFLIKERLRLIDNQVRFRVIGDISKLPLDTQNLIHKLQEETKGFTGLKLTFAFGYGARKEIIQAANQFYLDHPGAVLTEEIFSQYLSIPEAGDVDLMIRTSGECRISNFLLWQNAYAEFYFTETMWPDFSAEEFLAILDTVSQRERRFGLTKAAGQLQEATSLSLRHQQELSLGRLS